MLRTLTKTAFAAVLTIGFGPWSGLPEDGGLPGAAHAAEIVDMTIGEADAKVEVIEYASFTCGHCARFSQDVMPELKKNYIDTGKIRFTHRDVYFDRYGLWASMVARCGGEMRYFGIADLLFKELNTWSKGEPAEVAENLKKVGRKAGLSDDQLSACLQDAEMAQSLVDWYEANAHQHGINSTPSFIIDGEKYTNMSYDDFAKLLDEKLGE